MASLRDEFLTRFEGARAIRLTNPGVQRPTEINQAKLDAAIADAESDFQDEAQQAYNGDLRTHVRAGVKLVEAILIEYGSGNRTTTNTLYERALERCRSLREGSTRGRIPATGGADVTPQGKEVQQLSDDPHWRGYVGRHRHRGQRGEWR